MLRLGVIRTLGDSSPRPELGCEALLNNYQNFTSMSGVTLARRFIRWFVYAGLLANSAKRRDEKRRGTLVLLMRRSVITRETIYDVEHDTGSITASSVTLLLELAAPKQSRERAEGDLRMYHHHEK